MIYAGVDVVKVKHDYLITDSDRIVLFHPFKNNYSFVS